MGSRFVNRLLVAGLLAGGLLAAAPLPGARAASPAAAVRPPVTWLRGDGNYTKASRTWRSIHLLVIHATEGPFWGSVAWLKDQHSYGSAHYIVARSGAIVQIVHRSDIAWHAGNPRVNRESIGIEHEGITDDPAGFTLAEYRSSARLTAWIARQARLPIDRAHIIGHSEVPDPLHRGSFGGYDNHTDPGRYWNWRLYLRLVRRYAFPQRFRPLQVKAAVPAEGRGYVAWHATTTGPRPKRVEFRVDGQLLWVDRLAPFAFAAARGLNTTLLRNGRHVLETRAIAGRRVALARHVIRVRNRPFELALRGLRRRQRVKGVVRIRVLPEGARATRVQLVLDGRKIGRDIRRPFALRWDTRRTVDGRHTVVVYARAADERLAKRRLTVTVKNRVPKVTPRPRPKPAPAPAPAPTVFGQSVSDGQSVEGVVDWQVQAANAVQVEFLVDGAARGSAAVAPFAYAWDASAEAGGEHVLTARAVGRDGRVAEASARVTVIATSPPAP